MKNDMITTEQAVQELSKALEEFGNAASSAFLKMFNFEKKVGVLKKIGKVSADRIKRR